MLEKGAETLGNRIRELRLKKNITQKELAELLGVSQQAVANYEKGKRIPKAKTQLELAGVFKVPISYVMGLGFSNEELEKISYNAIYLSLIEIIKDKSLTSHFARSLSHSFLLEFFDLKGTIVQDGKILPYEKAEEKLKAKLNNFLTDHYFQVVSEKIADQYAFYDIDYSKNDGIQNVIKRNYVNKELLEKLNTVSYNLEKKKEKELSDELNIDFAKIFLELSQNERELKRALLTGKIEKSKKIINQDIDTLNRIKKHL